MLQLHDDPLPQLTALLPHSNAVQTAFIASLEAQLAQTRADLSEQYKIQSTNAQRLLVLTDNLRDAEERGREERDELRRLRNEVEGLRERAKWHQEIVTEKERQIVVRRSDPASSAVLAHLSYLDSSFKTSTNPSTSSSVKTRFKSKTSRPTTPPFSNGGSKPRTARPNG